MLCEIRDFKSETDFLPYLVSNCLIVFTKYKFLYFHIICYVGGAPFFRKQHLYALCLQGADVKVEQMTLASRSRDKSNSEFLPFLFQTNPF